MKFAAIALVFALGLSVANAACPALPLWLGIKVVGDSSGINTAACTAGQVLAAGAKCDVKLDTGYSDPNSGTTEYSCASDDTTLTSATLAGTGCLADYKNDFEWGCSACGTGEYSAGDVDNSAAPVGQYCDGCKANFYQSAGTSASDGACTACAEGKTLATAPFGGATTECESSGQTLATIAECCRDPTCAPSYDAWACIDALEASSATSSDCTSEDGDPVGAFKACGEYVYGTGGFTGEEVRLGALEAGTAQDAALCNLYKAAVTCAKSTSDACLVTFKAMCTNGKPDTCDADCSGAFSIKTGILATTALALLTSVVGLSF